MCEALSLPAGPDIFTCDFPVKSAVSAPQLSKMLQALGPTQLCILPIPHSLPRPPLMMRTVELSPGWKGCPVALGDLSMERAGGRGRQE